MEKEPSARKQNHLENTLSSEKTPLKHILQQNPKTQTATNDVPRNSTPNPVQLPKFRAFALPERYRSPTDLMISPVSKGLLARRASMYPPKILGPSFQETGLSECQ